MEPLIPDTSTETRMAGLERFLESYLGPRRPEFGSPEQDVQSIPMPAPLQRFFRFAGRWPAQASSAPASHRFCVQDALAGFDREPTFRVIDTRLLFAWENQGVWAAATETAGEDPPVWISEDWDRETSRTWRQLDHPLSHFLVSFVLQEVLNSSELLATMKGALEKFQAAGMSVQPVWIRGEYAWDIDRPSYFLVDDRFLVRRALEEGYGNDWYACKVTSAREVLKLLAMPTELI